MPNLFITCVNLEKIKKNKTFTQDQNDFILKILEGTGQWSALESLAATPNTQQLNHLKTAITEEISKTSYFSFKKPFWNYQYLKTLKGVLHDIQGTLDHQDHLATFSIKNAEMYNKLAKRMDALYKHTPERYNGTLILPVIQALEPRIGNSGGECFGYVAKWAAQILKKERPFGLHVNQKNTFDPIPFHSLFARKHPEINHLALLTKEISLYQKAQVSVQELMRGLSEKIIPTDLSANNELIDFKKNLSFVFCKSTVEMAQSLVDKAHKDPSNVYNMNIMSYMGGHALGFCLIDSKYHFFDSNAGWFRFDDDKDFMNWFVYYYKQRGYESYYFKEYAISTYSLANNQETKPEAKKTLSWTPGNIILFTLFSPIIVPIITGIVIGILANLYIIRGLRYLGIRIKDYCTGNNTQPEEEVDFTVRTPLREHLPKSLDPLDLAVGLSPKKKVTQSKNVLEYLDLSVGGKRAGSCLFFKEPDEVGSQRGKDVVEKSQYQLN